MTIICFSHLRWGFVYQRPQHLMSRFAEHYPVYFFEEPIFQDQDDHLRYSEGASGVHVVTPVLRDASEAGSIKERQHQLLKEFFSAHNIKDYLFWYYSPLMYLFSDRFTPKLVVYDCMDELSAFKFASPELKMAEQKLFGRADIVFTGGPSLYQAKRHFHSNIYLFPSSIDREHFMTARLPLKDARDQMNIGFPRFGYFGVLDERFDGELIRVVSSMCPDWNFVFVGPTAKVTLEDLPQARNIFYLGQKSYEELPAYISNWDVALIPFADNPSTRYISPTKTPEYLAAGKPVISTPIRDVLTLYGDLNMVAIVSSAKEFVRAGKKFLEKDQEENFFKDADDRLKKISWNKTFEEMHQVILDTLGEKRPTSKESKSKLYV